MSYTPTTWVTGDTITATKLNKMEQGIADAGGGYDFVITGEWDGYDWTNLSLESGSYSALATAIQNGTIIKGIFVASANGGTYVYHLSAYSLNLEDEPLVAFTFIGNQPGSSTVGSFAFVLFEDGTVAVD